MAAAIHRRLHFRRPDIPRTSPSTGAEPPARLQPCPGTAGATPRHGDSSGSGCSDPVPRLLLLGRTAGIQRPLHPRNDDRGLDNRLRRVEACLRVAMAGRGDRPANVNGAPHPNGLTALVPVLCYAIATIPGHILPITGMRIRARGTYTVHWPVYRISTQVKSSHRVVVFSQHHSRLHNVHR